MSTTALLEYDADAPLPGMTLADVANLPLLTEEPLTCDCNRTPCQCLDYAPLTDADWPPLTEREAHYLIDRISGAQERTARIQANAAALIAQEWADLGGFLGWENRAERLEAWTAEQLTGKRRTVTTLYGSVGFGKSSARCVVVDEGAAKPWLREHCPDALAEKIVAKNLPKPVEGRDEHGAAKWTAPCPGLNALGESDRFKVNGKLLRAGGGVADESEAPE